jgi:PD-(D/E)XK nuclease superfamily
MNADPGPIPAFLDRRKSKPLVGSFSLLNQYLNCPHAAFHRYIAKTYPYIQSDAAKEGDAIHLAMENRLRIKQPLPPKYAQWEPFALPFDAEQRRIAEKYQDQDHLRQDLLIEQKIGIDKDGKPCGYFDQNVWFRGRIDAAVVQGSKAYICDWKSGKSAYEDSFEIEIGAVLLATKFDVSTIKGQYAWLAENRLGKLYNLSDTNKTFAKMRHLMDEIERDRARAWFEKRKSGLCGYCNVERCENYFVARPK